MSSICNNTDASRRIAREIQIQLVRLRGSVYITFSKEEGMHGKGAGRKLFLLLLSGCILLNYLQLDTQFELYA